MNNNKTFVYCISAGSAAVALGVILYFRSASGSNAQLAQAESSESAAHADAQLKLIELNAENEQLKEQIKSMAASNDVLATQLAQTAGTNAVPTATIPAVKTTGGNPMAALFRGEDGSTNGMAATMQKMMKAQLDQQMQMKMTRMTSRLKLTADQESQIRELLTKANEKSIAATQKMFGGEIQQDDLKEAAATESDAASQVEAVLTPEQSAEYKAMQKEEAQNNARLVANAEMLQMQNNLALTQEQQDKVFTALYQQTVDAMDPTAIQTAQTDPSTALQNAFDQKLAALRGILTEEQLKTYRESQLQQMKMIEAFLPGKNAGQPATPTVIAVPGNP